MSNVMNELSANTDKSIQALQKDLLKVRTGRASTALIDHVHVDYYGSKTPITQVANLTTPDARTIQIVAWEPSMLGAIEKAIFEANVGFTPQNDGKVIRITMPPLTEERRKEMVKMIKKVGEDTKIAIRNHRRDANEAVKKQEKDKAISADESKKFQEQIQKKTDDKVAEVDKIIATKEKEIMTL
ncbi:MAG: ribosome recycling factor [Bdellovibrionales bacterium]|nr:ribosome recycling factor [Bdellovibrionales bacterium]